MIELEAYDLTKRIFTECVHMMKHIQENFLDKGTYAGVRSAAQVLVTVNFNYVLEAMPALPIDYTKRHQLIADLVETALRR